MARGHPGRPVAPDRLQGAERAQGRAREGRRSPGRLRQRRRGRGRARVEGARASAGTGAPPLRHAHAAPKRARRPVAGERRAGGGTALRRSGSLDPGQLDRAARGLRRAPRDKEAAAGRRGRAAAQAGPGPCRGRPAHRPCPGGSSPTSLPRAPDLARAARHESRPTARPCPPRTGRTRSSTASGGTRRSRPCRGTADAAAVGAHGEATMAKAGGNGVRGAGRAGMGRAFSRASPGASCASRGGRALAEAGILAPLGADGWIDGVIDLVLHDPRAERGLDRRLEDQPAGRRRRTTRRSLRGSPPNTGASFRPTGHARPGSSRAAAVRLWVYSTVAGEWTERARPGPERAAGGKIALDSPAGGSHLRRTDTPWEISRRSAASR